MEHISQSKTDSKDFIYSLSDKIHSDDTINDADEKYDEESASVVESNENKKKERKII